MRLEFLTSYLRRYFCLLWMNVEIWACKFSWNAVVRDSSLYGIPCLPPEIFLYLIFIRVRPENNIFFLRLIHFLSCHLFLSFLLLYIYPLVKPLQSVSVDFLIVVKLLFFGPSPSETPFMIKILWMFSEVIRPNP